MADISKITVGGVTYDVKDETAREQAANSVKTVNGVAPDASGNVVVSGGSGGISSTAAALLITILRDAVYSSDQSANIDALKTALFANDGSGDSPGGDSGDSPDVTYYTVTNALTNVSTSNEETTVASGSSYSATLTASEGFAIEEVAVLMGGVDITDTAYSEGVITIASVTGDIVVTASAVSVQVKSLNDYDYSEVADFYTAKFSGEGVWPSVKAQNPDNMWGAMSVDDEYFSELFSNESITLVAAHDDYGFAPSCKLMKTGGAGYVNLDPAYKQKDLYVDGNGNRYSAATFIMEDIKPAITENSVCVVELAFGTIAQRFHGVFGMILHNVPDGVITKEMLLNTIGGA